MIRVAAAVSAAPVIPSRRRLGAIWLAAAAVLGTALWMAQAGRSPLDDPDPAYQRPGFLDARSLPVQVPAVAGLPRPGRPAVVFFTRAAQRSPLLDALAADDLLRRQAEVVVVTAEAHTSSTAAVPVVADAAGRLGHAFAMRVPADGGPPVGYAVVDSAGRVRYATLDSQVASGLDEVATIVGALP